MGGDFEKNPRWGGSPPPSPPVAQTLMMVVMVMMVNLKKSNARFPRKLRCGRTHGRTDGTEFIGPRRRCRGSKKNPTEEQARHSCSESSNWPVLTREWLMMMSSHAWVVDSLGRGIFWWKMRRRLPQSHLSAENSGNKDFSETLAQVRVPEMQKSDEARFLGKTPYLGVSGGKRRKIDLFDFNSKFLH